MQRLARIWGSLAFMTLAGMACSEVYGEDGNGDDATPPVGVTPTTDAASEDPLSTSDGATKDGSADGSCGDTTSDPKNCGACGVDCYDNPCANSKCQPVVLIDEGAPVGGLFVHAPRLYWTAEYAGDVKSAPLGGSGKPVTFHVRGQIQPEDVVASIQGIYWTNLNAPTGLFSVPPGSIDSPVTTEVSGRITAFVHTVGSLTWATDTTPNVFTTKTLSGGATTPMGTHDGAKRLFYFGSDIYMTACCGTNAGLFRLVANAAPSKITGDIVDGYAADTDLYFSSSPAGIRRLPKAGPPIVPVLAPVPGTSISRLALTKDLIIFVESLGGGASNIVAVKRDGTARRLLATAKYAGMLVVDDKYAYYTAMNADGGSYISTIVRVPY